MSAPPSRGAPGAPADASSTPASAAPASSAPPVVSDPAVPDTAASSSESSAPPVVSDPKAPAAWDAELERRTDRRHERRLLAFEVLVLAIVGCLVTLRLLLVHGS